jgi:hypothetical protein
MHRFVTHPLDLAHNLSAVVPAQAGTHNPGSLSCLPIALHCHDTAYGSPPARERQKEKLRSYNGTA